MAHRTRIGRFLKPAIRLGLLLPGQTLSPRSNQTVPAIRAYPESVCPSVKVPVKVFVPAGACVRSAGAPVDDVGD